MAPLHTCLNKKRREHENDEWEDRIRNYNMSISKVEKSTDPGLLKVIFLKYVLQEGN